MSVPRAFSSAAGSCADARSTRSPKLSKDPTACEGCATPILPGKESSSDCRRAQGGRATRGSRCALGGPDGRTATEREQGSGLAKVSPFTFFTRSASAPARHDRRVRQADVPGTPVLIEEGTIGGRVRGGAREGGVQRARSAVLEGEQRLDSAGAARHGARSRNGALRVARPLL